MKTTVQPHDSSPLSIALIEERKAATPKKIVIIMRDLKVFDVVLEGEWNGSLIRSATNAIERKYRTLRHQQLRAVTAKMALDAKKEQSNG